MLDNLAYIFCVEWFEPYKYSLVVEFSVKQGLVQDTIELINY